MAILRLFLSDIAIGFLLGKFSMRGFLVCLLPLSLLVRLLCCVRGIAGESLRLGNRGVLIPKFLMQDRGVVDQEGKITRLASFLDGHELQLI